jgi:ABC-2 type transport system permease protein
MNRPEWMSFITMYRLLIRSSIRSRMQYTFNFWVGTAASGMINAVEFSLLAVVLHRFGTIQGWSMAESAYLYAVITLSKALYRSFASDVHNLEKYLVSGDLDGLLLRPAPVLLILMSQNFSPRFGETALGISMLAFSLGSIIEGGAASLRAVPLTVIAILSGGILMFGIGLLTASAGFWLTRIEALQVLTEDASRTAAQYPLTIYPGWLQGLLTGLIPIAFVNYMPSLYIIRGTHGAWTLGLSIAVAGAVLILSMQVWKFGLTRYQSTGS